MKKFFLVFFSIVNISFLYSQQTQLIPEKLHQNGFAQLDYLSIKMKNNSNRLEPNMGLAGMHYNLQFNNFYSGVGIYGSVRGERGGFFTLGINAGYQFHFSDNFYTDVGFHFGGGGGASAPDGGGAFILPHANLAYRFKHVSLLAGWSYINFFDGGDIKNHQINVALRIPLSFDFTLFNKRESKFSIAALKTSKWNQIVSQLSFLVHLNNLDVKGNSQFTNGEQINGKIIGLSGFEIGSYLNKNVFAYVRVDGAYKGIQAGYMDAFIGGGYQFWMNRNRTNILAKFALGASGGGGVDTKGGFLVYPDISLEQKIATNLFIAANVGYIAQPSGDFRALNYGGGLKYYIDKDGIFSKQNTFSKAKFKGLETIVKEDFYLNAKRVTGIKKDMYQISLQLNFFFNKYIYGAAQTSFANFGDAGAYAEGIVGIGVETNTFFNKTTSIFTQVLGGAAGGGGMRTGEGLIVKPSLGVNYKISPNLKLRGALGYVKARGDGLSNTFVNFGLNYNLSFLSVK
ncbi:hypothetical protein [Tenacibaculum sp. UWU-22]|uniref:hypothetical protein n=1 Tax=Tenacibaculum sp. UWU-22 TaxID=3234187 RepID=UPI0034DAC276